MSAFNCKPSQTLEEHKSSDSSSVHSLFLLADTEDFNVPRPEWKSKLPKEFKVSLWAVILQGVDTNRVMQRRSSILPR